MGKAKSHAELFSLTLGVMAAAQGTGTIPGTAGLTGIELITGTTAAIVTQAALAMTLTEASAVTHLIASGEGTNIMISPLLKVHPCCLISLL